MPAAAQISEKSLRIQRLSSFCFVLVFGDEVLHEVHTRLHGAATMWAVRLSFTSDTSGQLLRRSAISSCSLPMLA